MNEYTKQRLIEILKRMEGGRVVSPNNLARELAIPRYFVLATLNILEAIGAIRLVIHVGNTKIYTLAENGKILLDALQNNKTVKIVIEG